MSARVLNYNHELVKAMKTFSSKEPTVGQALVPVLSLITLLAFSVYLFGEDASYGPNQIALCLGAAVAAAIA